MEWTHGGRFRAWTIMSWGGWVNPRTVMRYIDEAGIAK